jgi:hypothetical protein
MNDPNKLPPQHGQPRPTIQPGARHVIQPPPRQPPPDLDPISLDEEPMEIAAPPPVKKIQAFGSDAVQQAKKHDWKRQTNKTGQGATRVKSFHGKYSDQGLQYLDDAINEWLDNHPEAEVKFVSSTVHVFEGKIREPALVLNLWY